MDGLFGEDGEEEFEDLGVIEGDEENHDEGSRTIMSLSNKLSGMNMQPSLKKNGENYVMINHLPNDEDEIMRKILEESIKTAEEEEKKRNKEGESKGPKKEEEKEAKKDKEIVSLSE
jgi:hypothetical protein